MFIERPLAKEGMDQDAELEVLDPALKEAAGAVACLVEHRPIRQGKGLRPLAWREGWASRYHEGTASRELCVDGRKGIDSGRCISTVVVPERNTGVLAYKRADAELTRLVALIGPLIDWEDGLRILPIDAPWQPEFCKC